MNSIRQFTSQLLQPADDYRLISWLFLKFLALIYFAAFLSLAVQITGLAGPNGILPYQPYLEEMFQRHGYAAWLRLPTLFWMNASDLALQGVVYLGCVLSVLLFFGYRRYWLLALLFVCYLSLFHAGQTFLTFQWDTLLMETGFLSIFLANGPPPLLVFLYHWLLFRFRFMSGIFKLASGDPSWSGLTALNYYFETQPLPHTGSWYAHLLPEWMLQGGVLLTFFSELIVPFFIFLPGRFRIFAALVTVIMQSLIIATSNHNFVNLLTILLCLFLLDDSLVRKVIPVSLQVDRKLAGQPGRLYALLLPVAGLLIVTSSVSVFYHRMTGNSLPTVLSKPAILANSFGLGHIFHVFPTMQTERQELQVEGSYDGKEWRAYTFRYKPGPLDRRPPFIVPHQPRLDWSMWFVVGQSPENMYWFDRFMKRLWEGSPQVTRLLARNPFEKRPPKYLRALVYRYHFTTPGERAATGNWWKREYLGVFPYLPPRRP